MERNKEKPNKKQNVNNIGKKASSQNTNNNSCDVNFNNNNNISSILSSDNKEKPEKTYNKSINNISFSGRNQDRPINSSGKYNLNFIDWNNEWERINEVMLKLENNEEVDDKEEAERIRKYIDKEREKKGITVNRFEKILAPDTKKECYICLKNFSKIKTVRKLYCKHMFCEECLLPWLKYNSKCPVCKFDLNTNNSDNVPNEELAEYDYNNI